MASSLALMPRPPGRWHLDHNHRLTAQASTAATAVSCSLLERNDCSRSWQLSWTLDARWLQLAKASALGVCAVGSSLRRKKQQPAAAGMLMRAAMHGQVASPSKPARTAASPAELLRLANQRSAPSGASPKRKFGALPRRKPCSAWGCTCSEVGELEAAGYPFRSSRDYHEHHPAVRDLAKWCRRRGTQLPAVFRLPDPRFYRTRSKLAVGPAGGVAENRATIGLFRKGTWQVVPARDCSAHHPVLVEAIDRVQQALDELPAVQPFNHSAEKSWDLEGPALRYIEITVERPTQRAMLVLVWNGDGDAGSTLSEEHPELDSLIKRLWPEEFGDEHEFWHSMWVHWRRQDPKLLRAIHSRHKTAWQQIRPRLDEKHMEAQESLDGVPFAFGPASFQQANLAVFEKMLRDMKRSLRQLVPRGFQAAGGQQLRLLELFSGVGVIGLSLMHSTKDWEEKPNVTLLSTDENPPCARSFSENAERIVGEVGGKATFRPLPAADAVRKHALGQGNNGLGGPVDVIIMDPPRRGLARRSMRKGLVLVGGEAEAEAIRDSPAQGIIYMSCGHRSFMADAERLTAKVPGAKPFHLAALRCYDMFPFTPHIETLGIFVREMQ